jgi:hypothetical protein
MLSTSGLVSIFAALILFARAAFAQPLLAPTPPMGWNSWDSFGTGVTEDEVKANADYMARDLARYGWEYIVVDIQWSEANPKTHGYRPNTQLVMDANGRLMAGAEPLPLGGGQQGIQAARRLRPLQGLEVRNAHHARDPAARGGPKPADFR